MSVTFKILTLIVISLSTVSSLAAEKKQEPVKAHQTAKSKLMQKSNSATEVKNNDLTDLTVDDATLQQDANQETMEFYSQLPSEQETEKKK